MVASVLSATWYARARMHTLQHVCTHCNTLQHTHCNTLTLCPSGEILKLCAHASTQAHARARSCTHERMRAHIHKHIHSAAAVAAAAGVGKGAMGSCATRAYEDGG